MNPDLKKSKKVYDVAVVGAGPAGTSAALHLAENNLDVIILDKATFPRYKVCGGGLTARARSFLPADLEVPVERNITQVALKMADSGRLFRVTHDESLIDMTMRSSLDLALFEAAERKGVKALPGTKVRSVGYGKHSVAIGTESGSVEAKYLIAADGAKGIVSRSLGIRETDHLIPAVEWEIRVADKLMQEYEDLARFDYGVAPRGYGWIFPKSDFISGGLLTFTRGQYSLKRAAQNYIENVLGRENILSVEQHGFVIPVKPLSRLDHHSRVLLTGDAAGLVDPLTAEGIAHAILSGQLAARAIIDSDLNVGSCQSVYQRLLQQNILRELNYARLLANVFYLKPELNRRLMAHFGQSFCDAMVKVMTGNRTYRELLLKPGNYLRLLATRFRQGTRQYPS